VENKMLRLQASWFDRIVSVISYLTAGWGGIIVLVLMYIRKKSPSSFLTYNVSQSILVSLIYFILAMSMGIILQILSLIPIINYLTAQITFIFSRPVIGDYSLIQAFVAGLVIYMSVLALAGKYPRVFFISRILDKHR